MKAIFAKIEFFLKRGDSHFEEMDKFIAFTIVFSKWQNEIFFKAENIIIEIAGVRPLDNLFSSFHHNHNKILKKKVFVAAKSVLLIYKMKRLN